MSLIFKFTILTITLISCSNNLNCSDLRTGKFEIIDPRFDHHTIIDRDQNYQIETNQKTGSKTKMSIKWVNDCKYIMTYLETDAELLKNYIGKKAEVEITKIEGSKIYFDLLFEGFEDKISFYMTKIE